MGTNAIGILIENAMPDFNPGEINFSLLARYKQSVKDSSYFDFVIESGNCGFFFSQALQLYEYSSLHEFNDIDRINSLLQSEYKEIFDGLIAFGQDVFGMQFCFDIVNDRIVFFNTESGEREIIATGFVEWINVVFGDLDYFTGGPALKSWLSNNSLDLGQRLCPAIPFIMGGDYEKDNLYAATFPASIKAYANIARQVYNLPDGTRVRLNVRKK